ncbi:MAG: DUF4743 domain-containing protein [Rhodospirillaceae bacterium]|nr:DUF4743 domain-containing protein [Rhodospirillaceae bacterium]
MSFLDRIREINRHDPDAFAPFAVDGRRLGAVRKDRIGALLSATGAIVQSRDGSLTFADALAAGTPEAVAARNRAMAAAAARLAETGAIAGLRSELYTAARRFGETPAFVIDRAAVPFFGLRAWGVHLNGYTWRDGAPHMWIGRRAKDKPTYPGRLDNMVAGGQPVGLGLMENLVKECAEEADIPETLARQARPVGAITYVQQAPEGLKPDVQFCFDLELPPDFVPRNTDGEIESFALWPIERVAETVAETREFKDNCNLVIVDFLIRHGFIPPDNPDYVALVRGLRP